MNKWKYKRRSPAGGKIYHKGDRVMIVYDGLIKLFCDIPEDRCLLPCNAEYKIVRKENGRVNINN